MARFLVSYDLMAPGKDYSTLYTRLGAWQACHAINSVWFVDSDTTAAAIRDDLRGYIDANDRLLVAALSGESAWTILMPGAAEWLQSRFGKA
jgi:hypothetical protein